MNCTETDKNTETGMFKTTYQMKTLKSLLILFRMVLRNFLVEYPKRCI